MSTDTSMPGWRELLQLLRPHLVGRRHDREHEFNPGLHKENPGPSPGYVGTSALALSKASEGVRINRRGNHDSMHTTTKAGVAVYLAVAQHAVPRWLIPNMHR